MSRHPWIIGAIAAALGIIVYLNALKNPFVYDDYVTVVSNVWIANVTNLRAIVLHDWSRPVVNFSYAVDRAVWGVDPFGFHLTNIALHALNVALLFALALQLTRNRIAAGIAAVVFAVHPMMTEAVGYVSGRSELVSTTWFLLAMMAGFRWLRDSSARWGILTVALWVLTLASKEIGAMFPVVLFAYDCLAVRDASVSRSDRLRRIHAPLIGIAVVAAIARLVVFSRVEHAGETAVQWHLLPMEVDVIRRYVLLLLVPVGQTILHDAPTVSAAAAVIDIAIVGGLVAVAWRVYRASPLVSFGITWFFVLLVPSTALVLLGRGEPMTEHRVYLASCGLFVTAGVALSAIVERSRVAAVGLAAIVVVFGALTMSRNAIWHNPIELYGEAVDRSPDNVRARLMFGQALQDAGQRREALDQYGAVVRLRPNEEAAYMKAGMCLAEMGRLNEATAAFQRLQQVNPRSAFASNGLGAVAMLSHRPDLARQYYADALKKDPQNISARESLAMIAEMEPANPAEALRLCEEVERLAPGTPGIDDCIRRNRRRVESERR